MVCFDSRRLAAGFFICSAVLGACGGKKEEGKATDPKGGGASAASNKDLDMIPAESELVAGVDLAQAQKSSVFREVFLPELMGSEDSKKVIETLKTKCNIDPFTAANRLTVGVKDMSNRNFEAVAVLHGIEKAKALPCFDKVKDDLAAEKVEVVKDGETVTLKSDDGAIVVTFTGDTTAVLMGGVNANKDRLLAVVKGKSELASSPTFKEMYGRVQTGHTVWGVVKGSAPMIARNVKNLDVNVKAAFGSLNMTDKLEINGRAVVDSADQAQKLADTGKMVTAFAGKSEKAEVEAENNETRLLLVYTQSQIDALVKRAKALRGR